MKKFIRIQEFCEGHELQPDFVFKLEELGLIQVVWERHIPEIHRRDLEKLERLVRLHRELEINLQGLQAVQRLLEQLSLVQQENLALRNLLGRWQ